MVNSPNKDFESVSELLDQSYLTAHENKLDKLSLMVSEEQKKFNLSLKKWQILTRNCTTLRERN